jgi:mono/diheme cytochrome c family protein
MAQQPAFRPLQADPSAPDDRSARPPVAGTVARGHLRTDEHFFTGRRGPLAGPEHAAAAVGLGAAGNPFPVTAVGGMEPEFVDTFPFPITDEVMERGRERYNIFCAVCHDRLGTGNGMIVRRGYNHPPSYHEPRLRAAPVGHFYDVITRGYGAMPDYAAQIQPRDRWAIVAYVRALQLSQDEELAQLPGGAKP